MQLRFPKIDILDPEKFIRRAGYGLIVNRQGERSYSKRLSRDLYPRYHVYLKDEGDSWLVNLHLDQRAPVYEGVTAHAGEYEGEVVEREADKIKQLYETKNYQ